MVMAMKNGNRKMPMMDSKAIQTMTATTNDWIENTPANPFWKQTQPVECKTAEGNIFEFASPVCARYYRAMITHWRLVKK